MEKISPILNLQEPQIVGSFGDDLAIQLYSEKSLRASCDIVEIRLDLLSADMRATRPWRGWKNIPLLFTARRPEEGGKGELSAKEREQLLLSVLDDASLIDIECASIQEMQSVIEILRTKGTPWIASYHDFQGKTEIATLQAARQQAKADGAIAFKAAIEFNWDTKPLTEFATFLTGPGLPISLMGMGPLAPVSRLLFAQLGSVLNYGYLGTSPTAPGQWSAARLKEALENSAKHEKR